MRPGYDVDRLMRRLISAEPTISCSTFVFSLHVQEFNDTSNMRDLQGNRGMPLAISQQSQTKSYTLGLYSSL